MELITEEIQTSEFKAKKIKRARRASFDFCFELTGKLHETYT